MRGAALSAVINAPAFEQVADPEAMPDELFAWTLGTLLGSAASGARTDEHTR